MPALRTAALTVLAPSVVATPMLRQADITLSSWSMRTIAKPGQGQAFSYTWCRSVRVGVLGA